MVKGIIADGKIPIVELTTMPVDLSAIPPQHRTRFFNAGELDALAHLLRGKKRILEIGCQNGRTAKAILSNRPDIEIYVGVDVPPGTQLACDVQRSETPEKAGELALDDERFILCLSRNGSAYPAAALFKDGYFDAVFIDGDHSREAVIRDDNFARAIVRPGGVIVHHDYHSLGTVGVREAIHEMAADKKFYHVADTWLVYSEVL